MKGKIKDLALDIGCGRNKHKNYIGIDIALESDADAICDLNHMPLPFKDCIFDSIILQDVIEHLDDIDKLLKEIYRIAKQESIIKIRTPHYSSYYAYNDLQHKHYFGCFIFNNHNMFLKGKLKLIKRKIIFPKIWKLLGLSYIFNKYTNRYEQLFCFLFRAENLYFEIRVIK